jgi:hypothetical protein
MKILLIAYVFYMNPSTKKVELLWQETLPQESMEMCKDTGEQYKYAVEASIRIEVRYFCVEKLSS